MARGSCGPKIDMASPNLNMRDPVMYRIVHAEHHRTGKKWCIYPMYDFAHGQSDSIERITHSICTLEFEDHRPLYNWFVEQLGIYHPQQIEFDRLNLTYTLLSKRKLLTLVKKRHVRGWDDPRMPTICGHPAARLHAGGNPQFLLGHRLSKTNGTIELGMLEHFVREDLNKRAPRVMAVLRPLKVVIDNYPEGQMERWTRSTIPKTPAPARAKFHSHECSTLSKTTSAKIRQTVLPLVSGPRSAPALRLFYDLHRRGEKRRGEVMEVHCTYDPASRGGNSPDGRKVKSTIHWVSAAHALDAEVRLYENLFITEDPNKTEDGQEFTANLNPHSLEVVSDAKLEPSLQGAPVEARYQFERLGYFCVDADSAPEQLVFNRTVALKDTWTKIEKKTENVQKR